MDLSVAEAEELVRRVGLEPHPLRLRHMSENSQKPLETLRLCARTARSSTERMRNRSTDGVVAEG